MPGSADTSVSPVAPKKKRIRWWDTWQALVGFVAVLLSVRFLVFEPFKIPSGSMEPALIGHEEYGDRIVTNKLAYRFGGKPSRFDVVVFDYQNEWDGKNEKGSKHYIKRLVGLPGESLVLCGGDLFLKDKVTLKESIIRKWEIDPHLQEQFWLPVSIASFRERAAEPESSEVERLTIQQENDRALPWKIETPAGQAAIAREEHALRVQGETTLTYRYPAWNTYVKMGRWPFQHLGCKANALPARVGGGGVPFRDASETGVSILPYLPNTWSGVRCPNCRQVRFPLAREDPGPGNEPRIIPDTNWNFPKPLAKESKTQAPPEDVGIQDPEEPARRDDGEASAGHKTPFFYGGKTSVGDLKLEISLEVLEPGGTLELEAGSNLHRAAWLVSLGGDVPLPAAAVVGRHAVAESVKLAAGATHTLSLAYVDGTVFALLDGKTIEQRPVEDLEPIGAAHLTSLARIRFTPQAKVRITRLNLFRDLYHTLHLDQGTETSPHLKRTDWEEGNGKLTYHVRPGHYMVLGDNSPSSKDSRVWGFVPREFLIGRASLIWWPPTRCRMMR